MPGEEFQRPQHAQGGFAHFWTTLPGILTAVAGLITAVAGIATLMNGSDSGSTKSASAATTGPPFTSPLVTSSSLDTAGPTTVPGPDTTSKVNVDDAEFTATLIIPLAGSGDTTSEINLSEGKVTTEQEDIEYARDDSTNRPILTTRHDTVSVLEPGEPISRQACEEAVDRRPVNPTIRQLRSGMSICIRDGEDGIGVIRIVKQPDRTGSLTVSVSYWLIG